MAHIQPRRGAEALETHMSAAPVHYGRTVQPHPLPPSYNTYGTMGSHQACRRIQWRMDFAMLRVRKWLLHVSNRYRKQPNEPPTTKINKPCMIYKFAHQFPLFPFLLGIQTHALPTVRIACASMAAGSCIFSSTDS